MISEAVPKRDLFTETSIKSGSVCVYACVCACVCLHVCVCVRECVCKDIGIHTRMRRYTYYTHTHLYVHVNVHTCVQYDFLCGCYFYSGKKSIYLCLDKWLTQNYIEHFEDWSAIYICLSMIL